MPVIEITFELDAADEIFTYRHHTGEIMLFDTTMLHRAYLQAPMFFKRVTIEITPEHYAAVLQYRGVEEQALAGISEARMQEPGYAVTFADGGSVTVDGHHRLVARYRAGIKNMDFLFPTNEAIWRNCLIDPPPDVEAITKGLIPAGPEQPFDISSPIIQRK